MKWLQTPPPQGECSEDTDKLKAPQERNSNSSVNKEKKHLRARDFHKYVEGN